MSHRGAIFSIVVVGLWAPELFMLATGSMTPTSGLVRMGLGVVLAWVAVGAVSRIVATYQEDNERASGQDDQAA